MSSIVTPADTSRILDTFDFFGAATIAEVAGYLFIDRSIVRSIVTAEIAAGRMRVVRRGHYTRIHTNPPPKGSPRC